MAERRARRRRRSQRWHTRIRIANDDRFFRREHADHTLRLLRIMAATLATPNPASIDSHPPVTTIFV
jgi:hypothetical protein